MGNVFASSIPSDKKMVMPPILPAPSSEIEEKKRTNLENPGTVEELHQKCKEVMAMNFEGAKVIVNKGLSNHFQVSHTVNLGTPQPNGYRFGAIYVGSQQFTPNECFPVLTADIDPSGNLNANIIHQLSTKVRCKFASQIKDSKIVAAQLTSDYKGDNFTASLTLGNPNIINNSGVFVAHYLQAVTEKLALGGELVYQCGSKIPGGQIAVLSAAARYTSGLSSWSATLGAGGIHVCYYQKASDQLKIGVEVETSFMMQESTATIGYQIDLPKANLIFRGTFDSNWNVGGVLEKRLEPLPFSFALSGRLNHNKNQFRLGCGLIIG